MTTTNDDDDDDDDDEDDDDDDDDDMDAILTTRVFVLALLALPAIVVTVTDVTSLDASSASVTHEHITPADGYLYRTEQQRVGQGHHRRLPSHTNTSPRQMGTSTEQSSGESVKVTIGAFIIFH